MRLSCRQCRTYLTAYIHNELTPRARRRVDAHLNTCHVCAAAYVQQQRTARDFVAGVSGVGHANSDRLKAIWSAVQAEIDTTRVQPHRMPRNHVVYIPHGAVILALVIALLTPTILRGTQASAQLPDPPTPILLASTEPKQVTHSAVVMVLAVATEEATIPVSAQDVQTQYVVFQSNYAPTPGATDSP